MKFSIKLSPRECFSTIRTKLTTVITFLIGAISVFIYIYFPSQLEERTIDAIAAKAHSIVEMTAFSIGPALFFEDVKSIEEALSSTKQNKDLSYLVVTDKTQRIITSFNKNEADELKYNKFNSICNNNMIYKTMTPIVLNKREIGKLYLGLSFEELQEEMYEIRTTIALVSLLIFIIGMVAVFGISAVITRPLSQMVETVKQISKGNLSHRAAVSSRDEVGQLAKSFNQMVDNLESAYGELENINQNLERRTEELQREVIERKRAEEALQSYAVKLERSNCELQDFAYVASHDLQEPLRKVQAFGDRLKAKCGSELSDRGREYLERMQNAARRMQILITDLLTYSRVTTKAQPFVLVDLTSIAQEVLTDLEVRIEEVSGHVEVGSLPAIEADQLQMRQLFQNLIGNALKFHRAEEPPVIKVQGQILDRKDPCWLEHIPGGELCQLIVADNGIGFDDKYQDRIFQVFQRLHGRSTFEGTGMGLAICRKIVERHGGKISVKSIVGQGATFTISLPVRQNQGGTYNE